MSEPPETSPTNTGFQGAAAGGIIGITAWQILSSSFQDVGFIAGLLILCAYMGLCMLAGLVVERLMSRD